MLEERTGDLFAQRDVAALGQGVNCVGKMGSGIAPQFKRRFVDMHAAYIEACRAGTLVLGGIFPWRLENGRWIYNLATQHNIGRNARLDAVERALIVALEHASAGGVESIAIPRIGAGIGGLDWAEVLTTLHQVADPHPVRLVVVSLPGA